MKTSIADIERAILSLTDANDIRRVIAAVREVQSDRVRAAADKFKRGDKVRFVHRHMAIVGTVAKINPKTMALRDCYYEMTKSPCVNYRVSPTFCTKVSA